MPSPLEERFAKAVYLIRHGPKKNSSNDEKLKVYSMFKQATEGDVTGEQPGFLKIEARAKWDAWNKLKGTSKEKAMEDYIAHVEAGDPGWEAHPALAGYTYTVP